DRLVVEDPEGCLVRPLGRSVSPLVQLPQNSQLTASERLRALHAEVGRLVTIGRSVSRRREPVELLRGPAPPAHRLQPAPQDVPEYGEVLGVAGGVREHTLR